MIRVCTANNSNYSNTNRLSSKRVKPLSFGKTKRARTKDSFETIPERFQLFIPFSMKIADVQRIIARNMDGTKIPVAPLINVMLNNTTVKSSEGLMIVKSDFIIPGLFSPLDTKGTVVLKGKPVYEKGTESITFEAEDIELTSNNPALNLADLCLHGVFVSSVRSVLTIGINDVLNEIKRNLNLSLKDSSTMGLKTDSNFDTLTINDIAVSENKLKLGFSLEGMINFFSSFENIDGLLDTFRKNNTKAN